MKNITRTFLVLFAVPSILFAAGQRQPPDVSFGRNGVTVGGLRPGTKVAWMAMIREPRPHRAAVRILRGFGPVTPSSTFVIELERADETRAIWTVVDLDAGVGVHARSPRMLTSARPIVITAAAGQSSVIIESGAVEVLYARPGRAAWSFSVADGGGRDGDGVQNGRIVMPLASLRPFQGNPHPPESVLAGDLILAIDPRALRTAIVEVER